MEICWDLEEVEINMELIFCSLVMNTEPFFVKQFWLCMSSLNLVSELLSTYSNSTIQGKSAAFQVACYIAYSPIPQVALIRQQCRDPVLNWIIMTTKSVHLLNMLTMLFIAYLFIYISFSYLKSVPRASNRYKTSYCNKKINNSISFYIGFYKIVVLFIYFIGWISTRTKGVFQLLWVLLLLCHFFNPVISFVWNAVGLLSVDVYMHGWIKRCLDNASIAIK